MNLRATSRRLSRGLLLLSLVALVFLGGCKKKKATTVPPQAQPPTIATPAPQPAPEVQPTQPTPPQPIPEVQPSQPKPIETPKPKRKSKRRAVKKAETTPTQPEQPAAGETAKPAPPKVVVGGGTSAPTTELSPDMQPAQAIRTRENTNALLNATQRNLDSLHRQLSSDDQATIDQIHNYMTQSRNAMNEGDLVRAHNLAQKANLLSEALLQHE